MRMSLETAPGSGVGYFLGKKKRWKRVAVMSRKEDAIRICACIWFLGQKENDKEKWGLMRLVIHRM